MFTAASGTNGSVILAGRIGAIFDRENSSGVNYNGGWIAIKLDADGEPLWEWQPQVMFMSRSNITGPHMDRFRCSCSKTSG